MKRLCGDPVKSTKGLHLVWRVSVAHSNSWYQITERGYFDDKIGELKDGGPLMKESEAILLARCLLEDALSRSWLEKSARKAIDKLVQAAKAKHQTTKR